MTSFRRIHLFRSLVPVIFLIVLWSCDSSKDEDPNGLLPELNLLNQAYGTDPQQTLDVYLPAGRSTEDTPIIIYIHGGAWIEGSKSEFLGVQPLMEKSFPEYAYVSIDYRLFNLSTGANKFPIQENDVIKSIEYILSKTTGWNISNKIILAGASAGGHLALLHGYKHQDIGNIQAVIAFFPPTDLVPFYNFNSITSAILAGLIGGTPTDQPRIYSASSPVTFINEKSVPTVFFHGTTDPVVPIGQSEILKKELESSSVPFLYRSIPGQGHGFTEATYANLIQEASVYLKTVLK
ncbi:MAG: alpha/beta hydrolase [Algoriphagus sp.]|nr:alpha/beta hydrolase [Algoriphagus sp.]